MHTQALVSCNRLPSPLCSSSFCGRRKFLKRALWLEHPSRSSQARRASQQCTRCLIATGGSDSEDDEPNQQPTPSTSGRGQTSASSRLGLNPDLEQPVPTDQRPVNELAALRETWLYSWVSFELAALMHLCFPSSVLFMAPFSFLSDYLRPVAGKVRDALILDKARGCLAWFLCACSWAYSISDI